MGSIAASDFASWLQEQFIGVDGSFPFKCISIKRTKYETPYLAVASLAAILFQMKYDNTMACSNYSNWLPRVQDDHVISSSISERSAPSPYFHAPVVSKAVCVQTGQCNKQILTPEFCMKSAFTCEFKNKAKLL